MRWMPLLAALLLTSVGCADERSPILAGRVIKVVDGDTLDVQLDSGPIRIRLHAVDTPERGQPHFKEAAAALSQLVMNKRVEVEPFEQDRYDRLVGIIHVDGVNVNAELIRLGHGWAFRRYMRKTDAKLCSLEAEARLASRGLWALADADLIAPWEYRTRKTREHFTAYRSESVHRCVAAIGARY